MTIRGIPLIIYENGSVIVDNSVLPDYGKSKEDLEKLGEEIGEYLCNEGFDDPDKWPSDTEKS